MMKKAPTLILLLSFLIPTLAFAQKKRKARKQVIVTDTIVAPIDIIEVSPIVLIEEDRGPVIEPVPEMRIFFHLTNTEEVNTTYAYFYCPQMEDSTFVYAKELGSDNNLAGGKSKYDELGYITIPKKYFAGREIRFKADGYKTSRVSIASIAEKDTITATLERDTYEYEILFDRKRKDKTNIFLLENAGDKFFYGRCRPIYYKDGNHADPACAFGGTGANSRVNEMAVLANVLREKDIAEKLYKKAKKKESVLYLYSPEDKDKNPKEYDPYIPVLEQNMKNLFTNGARVKLRFKMNKDKGK